MREERTLTTGNFGVAWNSLDNTGDVEFSRGGAMSLSTFFACVKLLADVTATLPLKAYKTVDEVAVLSKPQPQLLSNSPYPGITWHNWLWMVMECLATTGNAYLWVTSRNNMGKAAALMPVHPRFVTLELPDANILEWMNPVYHINGKAVPEGDIVHIKRFPVAGSMYGLSPVQKLANTIDLSLSAEKYGHSWFKDASNPSGILSTDQEITPVQAKETMKRWLQSHRNRRIPAVLGNNLKWQSVSITPEESQFLATREFQRSEIAMIFGVPPHMIGDTQKSTSWGTGIDAQKDGFVTFTMMGWLQCIEEAISALLPNGTEARFDLKELMRGDPQVRWKTIQLGILTGALSINEARAMDDLPPIPEGELRLQPMNYVPLGTPVSEYVPAAATQPGPEEPDDGSDSSDDSPADEGDEEGKDN
jgi:HK97 family phage portal protein